MFPWHLSFTWTCFCSVPASLTLLLPELFWQTLLEGQAQGITSQTAPPLHFPSGSSLYLAPTECCDTELRVQQAGVSHRTYILEEMDIQQIAAHIIVTNTVSALTRQRAVLSSTVVTCMCSSWNVPDRNWDCCHCTLSDFEDLVPKMVK